MPKWPPHGQKVAMTDGTRSHRRPPDAIIAAMSTTTPYREVRAHQTPNTVTVYQAYAPAIADAALANGRFVPPFKRERMTWIKPSFLWMAYRAGWATKPGQERILAVEISRDGFEWALTHSCLSHYERGIYPDEPSWTARLQQSCVRIQWDPERGLHHEPLDHRAIQIGLTGEAVDHYVDEWIISITDVTSLTKQIGTRVKQDRLDEARALLPTELTYELPNHIAAKIGAR